MNAMSEEDAAFIARLAEAWPRLAWYQRKHICLMARWFVLWNAFKGALRRISPSNVSSPPILWGV